MALLSDITGVGDLGFTELNTRVLGLSVNFPNIANFSNGAHLAVNNTNLSGITTGGFPSVVNIAKVNTDGKVAIDPDGVGSVFSGSVTVPHTEGFYFGNGYLGEPDVNWGWLLKPDTDSGGSANGAILDSSGSAILTLTDSSGAASFANNGYPFVIDTHAGNGTIGMSGGPGSTFFFRAYQTGGYRFLNSAAADLLVLSDAGTATFGQGASGSGAHNGVTIVPSTGEIHSSANVTTAATHNRFYNPNGQVGGITTSGTSTSYNTSSDMDLKENYRPITGALGMVRQAVDKGLLCEFDWKIDGSTTWGYLAQLLHQHQEGFGASPPDDLENGRWGVDQSKRVPVLEAAIYEVDSKYQDLEARLDVLEVAAECHNPQ